MGKGYWHDVDNARMIACYATCNAGDDWLVLAEMEFKYSLLEEENEKLKKELEKTKKELEEMKKKQRP